MYPGTLTVRTPNRLLPDNLGTLIGRRVVEGWLASLSEDNRDELVALLGAHQTDLARDWAEDHGATRDWIDWLDYIPW